MKEAKNLASIENVKINREIEYEKRKMMSFKLMLNKKTEKINRKIKELQKIGILIDKI